MLHAVSKQTRFAFSMLARQQEKSVKVVETFRFYTWVLR